MLLNNIFFVDQWVEVWMICTNIILMFVNTYLLIYLIMKHYGSDNKS